MYGLFDGAVFLLAFAVVLPLGLLALVVLVLAGGRDVDASGKRSFTLYVAIVSFVAIFTALIASTAVVDSLTQFIKDDDTVRTDPFDDFTTFDDELEPFPPESRVTRESGPSQSDLVWRGVTQGSLVLLAAAGVLWFHHRRRLEYRAEPGFYGSAAWRADRAYVHVVCFTAILIVLYAAGFGSYNIFRLAGPGVFVGGDAGDARRDALQALLTLAWLTLASAGIFRYFWLQARSRTGDEQPASSLG